MTNGTSADDRADELTLLRLRVVELERQLLTLRSSEEQLRVVAGRLEQAVAASPLATIEWDVSGSILRWNPGAEQIFGWSADEALGANIVSLLVPNIVLDQVQQVMQALLSGQVANSRNLNKRKDGHIITCQWYNAALYNTQGAVIGGLSQTEDVTEQVERECELRTFKSLVENALDGIAIADLDTTMVYANPAFRNISGLGAAAVGTSFLALYDAETQAYVQNVTTPAMRQEGHWQGILPLRQPGGATIDTQINSFVLPHEEGMAQQFVAFFRDVSELRQAEQERIALQEQIIAGQEAMLRELSTPLIPLAEGLVAMPLIGGIDSRRAQMVIETLLQGISETRATTAIIDITGVPVVDTQVADALLRAAQAASLLGARIILTGIRPEVAQTLVSLQVDMRGITTHSTLQSGVADALRRTRLADSGS